MGMRTHALGTRYRLVRLGLPPIAYVANKSVRLELPNGLIQKRLLLRLTGNLVVGTATATIFSEAPLGLISKVELVGDGRRFLASCDGRDLWQLTRFMNRKKPELAPPLGTVGTRAFSASMILDAEALNFRDKSESMLDTRLFKKLELVITFGSETSIATAGGGGTISVDATTQVDVQGLYTSEGLGKILFDHILSIEELDVTSTNPVLKFSDIPQSGLLHGFFLRTTRDAGAGAGPVPVDDIINNITLKSDVSIAHVDKAKWRTIQGENIEEFVLDGGDATTGQVVGYTFVNLTENHMFSAALNINGLNKAQILLDVTRTSGTERIHALYDFYEPRQNLGQEIAAA